MNPESFDLHCCKLFCVLLFVSNTAYVLMLFLYFILVVSVNFLYTKAYRE